MDNDVHQKKQQVKKKKDLLEIPPTEIYAEVQKVMNSRGYYFQISYQKIYELLGPDKIESSAEFLLFMVLVSKLHVYQNHFILSDKKLTPKKLALEIECIAGNRGKCLISYSQVAKIWKSFIEREVIKIDKRGIVSLYFAPCNKENSKNFLKVDISFFHKMIREAQTKNDFLVSFYMFTKFHAHAWRNLRFGHAINSIIDDLGGKIRSDPTLTNSIERLEEKEILLVKRYDTYSKKCNEYVIHPLFSSNLPIKAVDRRIEDQSLTIKAERSLNQDHNKKYIENIIENPLESLPSKVQKNIVVNSEISKETVEKQKDSKFHFELIKKFNLSSYAHLNLRKIKESIKNNPYFKDFSHDHLLMVIFNRVENKGAWPFNKNGKNEIKLPLDQYLTYRDKNGSIFEKVLDDYKSELQEKKRREADMSPQAKVQREYQEKVSFLQEYYTGDQLKSEYEIIQDRVLYSLSNLERESLQFNSWNIKHQVVQKKVNSLISGEVNKRFKDLKGDYLFLTSKEKDKKSIDTQEIVMKVCQKYELIGHSDGAFSHVKFCHEYMPEMDSGIEDIVIRYLEKVTWNNPEFSNTVFG